MTPDELAYFEKILKERKEQIIRNITECAKEINGLRDQELNDEGDVISASMDGMINEAISQQQQQELAEIDHALAKFRNNQYGICEMCEEEIDIERLKVKPHAKYCIVCRPLAEAQMNQHHNRNRYGAKTI
ncbi:MAG: RNA polymerase-binding protein DksA [Campylobacterales bacterium]